ncbi:MAG: metalloregulator ArsR/SmtB family transcription factor [Luteolibacter sp.]|nr:metalloregulator ArsR/SmtB family transcription factor [Luteolibacter sp.]
MPVAKLEAFEKTSVDLAAFAKVLGHPARICILRQLAANGEMPCMEIVAALPLSQPACSRHINDLRKAGLLKSRTLGSNVFFRIDESVLNQFCQTMNLLLHTDS